MGVITPKPITERNPGPFPANRRCAHRDCITLLSRYTPGPLCAQHAPAQQATRAESQGSLRDLMAELPDLAA